MLPGKMESPTLLASALAALASALAYAFVGGRLVGRPNLDAANRRALAAFGTWWLSLAAVHAMAGLLYLGGAFGRTDLELQLTYAIVQRLLVVVGLVGLMHYLIHLFTGRSRLLPLALGYGAVYVYLLSLLFQGQPTDVLVGRWRTDLVYTNLLSPAHSLAVLVILVFPPLVGSLQYFRLFFQVDEPAQRYRIALVSGAIAIWWLVGVVAAQRQLLEDDPIQIVNRVVGLLAAFAVLMAYEPPAWVRRRWRPPAAEPPASESPA